MGKEMSNMGCIMRYGKRRRSFNRKGGKQEIMQKCGRHVKQKIKGKKVYHM